MATLAQRMKELAFAWRPERIEGVALAATAILGPNNEVVIDGRDLSGLRNLISNQFSLRFQSTGDTANRAETRVLLETVGATHVNPYLVQFNRIMLTSFTGPGEFYLEERDASDVPGGESTITVATKDGFSAGYTPGIIRAITVDKIYRVAFIPGTTGDGIYSINISALERINPPIRPPSILPVIRPSLS